MKLGNLFRLSAGTSTDADDQVEHAGPDGVVHSEVGGSGTVNMRGFIQQAEYNPKLRGRNAYPVFDQMVWSDASVREAEGHVFYPLLNANWTVEPASQDPLELEKAELIRRALFEYPQRTWPQTLHQILKYLRYGSMAFELAEMVVEDELEIQLPTPSLAPPQSSEEAAAQSEEIAAAATSQTLPSRQFIVWRRFAPRLPKTIYRWNLDANGELESITQQVWSNVLQKWENVDVPAENLLVLTNDMDGEDFFGVSILRSAYKAWVLKELFEKIAGQAFERHGVGILTVYLPVSKAGDVEFRETIEDILTDLRAGESSYVIWPHPKASPSHADGLTFEIVSPSGTFPDFSPYLDYFRAEIKAAVLARFSELGHGAVGARSTADVQQQVWYDGLHAVARRIEDEMQGPIKRLLDKNYPSNGKYPRLHAADIESEDLLAFAQSVLALQQAEMLTADRGTRRWVRDTIDAPEEDVQEQLAGQAAQLRQQELEHEALASLQQDTNDNQNGDEPPAPPDTES